jgi:hypothetical protein
MKRLAAVLVVVLAMGAMVGALVPHAWALEGARGVDPRFLGVPVEGDADVAGDNPPAEADNGDPPPEKPSSDEPALKAYPEIAPSTSRSEKADVVVTRSGSRIVGKVLSLDPAGVLRLASPEFQGEVRIAVKAIRDVLLKKGEAEPGAHEVELAGGDRLAGTLKGITDDGIILETHAAGTVTIPAAAVRGIRLAKPVDVLLETNFLRGEVGPWKTRTRPGTWTVEEGGLVFHALPPEGAVPETDGAESEAEPGMTSIYAPLDQKEAITIVAKVAVAGGGENDLMIFLAVFSDSAGPYKSSDGGDPANSFGHSSVYVRFGLTDVSLSSVLEGNESSDNQGLDSPLKGRLLRMAYDPEAGKVWLWADGQELWKYDVPNRVLQGKFVMMDTAVGTTVEYVKVLRGVVPPTADDVAPAGRTGADRIVVHFTNGDRVSAMRVRTADGQFVLTTEHSEIRCPMDAVSGFDFPAKGPEPRHPAAAGYVRVQTAASRLTLQRPRLTADGLVGRSDCLGEVKLRRGVIQQIDFGADEKAVTGTGRLEQILERGVPGLLRLMGRPPLPPPGGAIKSKGPRDPSFVS